MDPISKLARTLGVVRRTTTARKPGSAIALQAEGANLDVAGRNRSLTQLRADIAHRLNGIRADAEGSRTSSVRLFLEHVLAHEFGQPALSSPEMQQTLRDVQRVMDADPGIRAELDDLLLELRQEATGL